MNLIKQGFYKEFPHGDSNGPSILSFVNKGKTNEKKKICDYLNNGIPIILCAGVSTDVLKDDGTIAGIPNILTDGTWVWPGDLSYYVENYNIKLSDDFLNTIRNNSWKIPIKKDDLVIEEISINGEYLFK